MKINEVETLVGVTKKNIRFYEEKGLLAPRRNSDNGYREYGEDEVDTLRRIKLLRKLGLPIEEIRRMQAGGQTVGDGMRRHIVSLEREQKNLEHAAAICQRLRDYDERLESLDAVGLLDEMEQLERGGTTFLNTQRQDTKRRRYIAPVVVTVLLCLLLAACTALVLFAFLYDPTDAPPLPVVLILAMLPIGTILAMVLALVQRIREIEKGEVDDAEKY